jgi:competence protein ComEC
MASLPPLASRHGRLVAAVAIAVVLPAPAYTAVRAQEPRVQVTFLDVGQGDAIVLVSPEGRAAMIDGGSAAPLRFLQQMSVDSIDLLVATHPHVDHIGGLVDVLTARPVRLFMDNGVPQTNTTYARLMATVDRLQEVTYLRPTPRTITLGSVTLEVLAMPDEDGSRADRSVGLVLRFGDFSAFLSGDSGRRQLDAWTRQGVVPDVVLLKAPRHGSVDGFTKGFLAASLPEVVVVSVGAGNVHGHPRPEALTAFAAVGAEVHRTDRDGHVTVLGYADGRFEIVASRSGDAGGPDGSAARPYRSPDADASDDDETPLDGSTEGAWVGRLALRVIPDTPESREGDLNAEYAVIANVSSEDVAIGGWRLCDLRTRCFRFPPDALILAGAQVRVYTGYGMSDGLSYFMNNDRAVWNDDGDEATLSDERGVLAVRHVY